MAVSEMSICNRMIDYIDCAVVGVELAVALVLCIELEYWGLEVAVDWQAVRELPAQHLMERAK